MVTAAPSPPRPVRRPEPSPLATEHGAADPSSETPPRPGGRHPHRRGRATRIPARPRGWPRRGAPSRRRSGRRCLCPRAVVVLDQRRGRRHDPRARHQRWGCSACLKAASSARSPPPSRSDQSTSSAGAKPEGTTRSAPSIRRGGLHIRRAAPEPDLDDARRPHEPPRRPPTTARRRGRAAVRASPRLVAATRRVLSHRPHRPDRRGDEDRAVRSWRLATQRAPSTGHRRACRGRCRTPADRREVRRDSSKVDAGSIRTDAAPRSATRWPSSRAEHQQAIDVEPERRRLVERRALDAIGAPGEAGRPVKPVSARRRRPATRRLTP